MRTHYDDDEIHIVKTKCELDIVDAKLSMMDYLVSLCPMAQR